MKKFCFIFSLIIFIQLTHSQTFKIVNFDFTYYPEISLLYESLDESENVITNAQLSDFKIIENGIQYQASKIRNPSGSLTPISVILVIDNSGSMIEGGRLEIVKKGIARFIKSFPFESSEMALESFSDDIVVNTDFTQKPERVAFILNSISSLTGTNFNNAFLKNTEGAIELMQKALNKKILIFITDGLSSANVTDIADKAIASGIQVYSLLIQLKAPFDLKNISEMTGGSNTETIANDIELANSLTAVLQQSQISRYGTLKWVTSNNCNANRNVNITFRNIPVNTNYKVPSEKIATLEVNPSTLYFEKKSDNCHDATIELVPHRSIFNITSVFVTKPEIFKIVGDSCIGKSLYPDSSFKIKIKCTLNDNMKVTDFIRISTKECPDKTVKLVAGTEEKLLILKPSGGEIFVPGMDTIVKWDGISANRKVDISFRSSPNMEWKPVDTGSKYLYKWQIPVDTCKSCQLKLAPNSSGLFELKPVKIFEFQGNSIKTIQFSADSKYLFSISNNFVVLWNIQNGLKERVYGGFKYDNAAFFDNNHTIGLFNKDKITLLKTDNNTPSIYSFRDKKIFTSRCFDNGNEELISAYLLKDKTGYQRIWMPGTSNVFFVDDTYDFYSASFSISNNYLVALDGKSRIYSWETKTKKLVTSFELPFWFSKAILGSSDLMALTGANTISLVTLPSFKVLWTRNDLNYIKYSQSGNQLFAADTSGRYCFIDCNDGKTIYSFNDYTIYQSSPIGRQILHYANDTLILYDGENKKNILKIVDPEIRDCKFSPDGKRILVVNGKNEVNIFEAKSGRLEESLPDLLSKANTAAFSPDNEKIAVALSNGIIQLFEKIKTKNIDEVISNTFSIIRPKLAIKDTINFGDNIVNKEQEQMIHSFAKNNTHFPISITGIEVFSDTNKVFSSLSNYFPKVLEPKDSINCEFKFFPRKKGIHIAYLKTYTSTDTFITYLTGNSLDNNIDIHSFNVNFDKVKVNAVKDTFAQLIFNNGKDSLRIVNIVNAGPDTIQFIVMDSIKNIKIAPGNFLNYKVRFAPKFRGLTTGYLNVFLNEKKDPQRIRLSGEGLAPRMITVKGTIRNILDSLPLAADLLCNDLITNKTISSRQINTQGQFCLNLNADRNYSLVASKINFISSSENIDLSNSYNSDTIYTDLWLTEIKSGSIIKFNCIFFEFGKSTLEDISKNDLNRMVKLLSDNKTIQIEIHGHTDNIGSDSANMKLSADRAKAVKQYISEKGISTIRIKTIAYGESTPIADNNSPEGRKANRRVEFKIR